MIGESLSHYRILEKLGAGGMGVVYKARDTRLDRVVALKILPQDLVSDTRRKQRFVAEAKAASALNHSNIVTIYDIGSDAGTDFIAMEYVPGKTLNRFIGNKPLRMTEAVGHAIQIAKALAAAHRAGIIHRDLKPGNIIVTPQRSIKLLDFGIAKLVEHSTTPIASQSSATQTLGQPHCPLTEQGQIVGTVSYMSPEQLTGGAADTRSDLFSFGIVLYEMLTGHPPFRGSTTIETALQILEHEPEALGEVVPGLPPALERIVGHCLRKNPEERLQSVADVARLLEDVRADLASGPQVHSLPSGSGGPQHGRRALLTAGGAVLFGCALLAGWQFIDRRVPEQPGPVLARLTFDSGLTTNPVVSRDGKLLAYASDRDGRGNLDIWMRQLAGGEPLQVTRDPADEFEPDFSPDGTKIVYRSNRAGGGVYITPTLGGTNSQMVAAAGHMPRFSPDGKWISYYTGERSRLHGRPMRSKLFVIEVATGETRQIEPNLAAAYDAIWSPDSRHLLFSGSAVAHIQRPADWYVAAVDGGKAVSTGTIELFNSMGLSDITPHVWAEGERVIFSAKLGDSTNIWQLPISPGGWRLKPPVKRLTSGTGIESHASIASAAASERLVFSVLNFRINLWTLPLDQSGIKPRGGPIRITDDEASVGFSDLTSDGNLLVFSSNRTGSPQIWSKHLQTGKDIPLTNGTADVSPTVAPDGSRFAYQDDTEQAKYIVTIGATTRSRRKIVEGDGWPTSWSADSAWLFYSVRAERWGIEAVQPSSGRRYVVFQHPGYDLTYLHPSPDSGWALASSFEDPVSRILIAPLRQGITISPADWFAIADDAAEHDRPEWSTNGTAVYYTSLRDGFRCIWAQPLNKDTKRPSGSPTPVFHSHSARMSVRNTGQNHFKFAVAPDKLVFNMGELRGNIWMATLPK